MVRIVPPTARHALLGGPHSRAMTSFGHGKKQAPHFAGRDKLKSGRLLGRVVEIALLRVVVELDDFAFDYAFEVGLRSVIEA